MLMHSELNLPREIAGLRALALDLRSSWSHEGSELWGLLDEELWKRTLNPWTVLSEASSERLKHLASDQHFLRKLESCEASQREYLSRSGWFRSERGNPTLGGVAYFSMEFGLSTALPIYAGGLGILAGDVLKSASDLDIPLIGIGLLYQEGYFRQMIDKEGLQLDTYPYNEPTAMPIEPVVLPDRGWLRISLELPGRTLRLRVWKVIVGRVHLYLLDSNDPVNSPLDRGITAKLYGGGSEQRLMQEYALGVGGWRVVEALHPDIEICHINEGHAAFAILERAHRFALKSKIAFWDAFWATRAGNVFTTHTPVAAAFDRFPIGTLRTYLQALGAEYHEHDVKSEDFLALGRADPRDRDEPFNMAFLAFRGSAVTMAVSRLHRDVARGIFQPLFPRLPTSEVPIGCVTNGIHIPTWVSAAAGRVWDNIHGKDAWLSPKQKSNGTSEGDIASDEELWTMRGQSRLHMVGCARTHLARQLREAGFDDRHVRRADSVLDPNVLTLGFARRFTEYKRPNLLLRDVARLRNLLNSTKCPIQIVVAGKAHPNDATGKEMIRDWTTLARDPKYRHKVVFLHDYDLSLAQDFVQGVDVWINTPRRTWEACGTSGMKVLVNGGINCSTLDGWWDEAYTDDVGWKIGDGAVGVGEDFDARDVDDLYDILETKIIPEFYDRDGQGLPRAWLNRIRTSMSRLTPEFSGARMMEDYVELAYLPLAKSLRKRLADHCEEARRICRWSSQLMVRWADIHIGSPAITKTETGAHVALAVYLGEIEPASVRVEMFAETAGGSAPELVALAIERMIPGSTNGYLYAGDIVSTRPLDDYTARVVPDYPGVRLPAELPLIAWQR